MKAPFLLVALATIAPLVAARAVPALPGVDDGDAAHSEVTIDAEGRKWVCADGVCRLVEDDEPAAVTNAAAAVSVPAPAASVAGAIPAKASRLIMGSRGVDEFLAFLSPASAKADEGDAGGAFGSFTWLTLVLVIVGGLALNLTPCVLPMIPVNLIIIGKSPARGAAYGVGMALAYGALGVCAAVGGLAFGTIQSNPWFNAFVAVVFVALALALFGRYNIDLSRFRAGVAKPDAARASLVVPVVLGALSAVLAGACVAPILISVLVLTARLYAEGKALALALPFALGLGMALPWPFLGAGMKVLPKPGAWMKHVNRAFAILVLCFAAWYARLAWIGWAGAQASEGEGIPGAVEATPATFAEAFAKASADGRPVFVDCWATWCKNCFAMDRTTLADVRVREALKGFAVIRLQADDIKALREFAPFADVKGLPAYAVFDPCCNQ